MSAKKYETCQHKYRNITCAADFLRNTRMFINIFFVVLLSLAHGNPVPGPSDPVPVIRVDPDKCREDPSLEGCHIFFEEEGSGAHLIKVEGGDEYLVDMESQIVSQIHSDFVRG